MKKLFAKYTMTILVTVAALVSFIFSDKQLLGGMAAGEFFRYLTWAWIGAYAVIQIDANYREVQSRGTPQDFSHRVMLMGNIHRFIKSAFWLIITIRFMPNLYELDKWSDFIALLVGMSLDALPVIWKNRTKILAKKQ